jgi:glucose/arabinose dehydrogenase
MLRVCHLVSPSVCGVALAFAIACSKQTPAPAPPVVTPPSSGETINGTERIGWAQRAGDAVELSTVKYAMYVDGVRSELAGATCDATSTADGFACSAKLPPLTAGAHTLELASLVVDGSVLESARSSALRVTVTAAIADTSSTAKPAVIEAVAWPEETAILVDGARLKVELVAGDLNQPTDLAFAPDGRLLIAQRDGTIRSVRDGTLSEPSRVSDTFGRGDRLLAIAVDPDFARTRFLFAIYTSHGSAEAGRDITFTLARVREVSGTLGDRAVLLDGIRAAASNPAAALRFGADGKLYAAFDDGGEPERAGDLSSSNGKILRLNADGTTPDDQAGASPLYASAFRSPAGLDWHPQTRMLWVTDRLGPAIAAVGTDSGRAAKKARGTVQQRLSLPAASPPSSAAFARGTRIPALAGNLLIASSEGRHLLRVRFDPLNPSRVATWEPLLLNVVGPVVAVVSGPDGAIYFATPRSVGRLIPE